MLESMKHWVAMGGAATAAAAAGAGAAPGTAPGGGAPAGGAPITVGGAGVMFSALAATGGNSNPVPANRPTLDKFKYVNRKQVNAESEHEKLNSHRVPTSVLFEEIST